MLEVVVLHNNDLGRASAFVTPVREFEARTGANTNLQVINLQNAVERTSFSTAYPTVNQNVCNAGVFLIKNGTEVLYSKNVCAGYSFGLQTGFDGNQFFFNQTLYNDVYGGLVAAATRELENANNQNNSSSSDVGDLFGTTFDFGGLLLPAAAAAIFLLFAK